MELVLTLISNSRAKIMCLNSNQYQSYSNRIQILFYLNKIDNGLSDKPKLL